mgnify:CR=1 FL=1
MSEQALAPRLEGLGRAAGITLSEIQVVQLQSYLQLLARWNERTNLTSLELAGFPETTLQKLIGEPFRAAAIMPAQACRWFDLGSGGGSPAIPLKVVRPDLSLWMVESRSKKVSFLREASRVVDLDTTTVVAGRVEDLSGLGFRSASDVVTVRAVRLSPQMRAAVDRLLAPDGRLVLFGGLWETAASDGWSTPVGVTVPSGLAVFDRQSPSCQ